MTDAATRERTAGDRATPRKSRARASNEAKIVAAAIGCFGRDGVAGTTMEDIAASAGVGRQTVYRTFPTRGALLDAVALERLLGMREEMKRRVEAYPTLESAMVDGTIDVRSVARRDEIFMTVVEAVGDHQMERYLLAPPPIIREIMKSIWEDVFASSRERGELRTDLTDLEIADWFRFINFTLLLREDLDRDEQKKLLRTFVLPGLLPPAEQPGPARPDPVRPRMETAGHES